MSVRTTWIRLIGMELVGKHGALPEEKDRPTHFSVDIEVRYANCAHWPGPELSHSLDYRSLEEMAREMVARGGQDTLEYMAHSLADRLVALPGVREYKIRIRKPAPPLETPTAYAEVEIGGSLE